MLFFYNKLFGFFPFIIDGFSSVWFSGCLLLLLSCVTSVFGYLLPWGNLGYYALVVIKNLINSFGKHMKFSLSISNQVVDLEYEFEYSVLDVICTYTSMYRPPCR